MGAILCNEGFVLTVVGIVGIFEGFRLNRVSAAADEAYGPGWYLLLLSLILIGCGLYYLASTFKKTKKSEAQEAFTLYGPATFAILAMMAYCLLLPYAGYFISTTAFVFAAARFFGERSWIKSILLAGISGGLLWMVFVFLAQIPMP